jgi:hypothetical protein
MGRAVREPFLGGAGRKKTDTRIPEPLVEVLKEIAVVLGVSMNAVFCLSVANFLLQMVPVLPGRKRAAVFKVLESNVQKLLEDIRSKL